MGAFIQIIQALFGGIGVGLYAIWCGIKILFSFNATRNMIIAAILNVPLIVVVIGFAIDKLIKFLLKH